MGFGFVVARFGLFLTGSNLPRAAPLFNRTAFRCGSEPRFICAGTRQYVADLLNVDRVTLYRALIG
jgi:hypothetical protein